MTFSISFPRILSKTIGLNDLGESYDGLLGLGMITVNDILKWFGQYLLQLRNLSVGLGEELLWSKARGFKR